MNLTLIGARVVDPFARTVSEPTTLHVVDGRITAQAPADATLADTFDCAGKFVMPGMVDAHVHLKSRDLRLRPDDWPEAAANGPTDAVQQAFGRALHSYLRCGVTSLFDAGNEPDVIFDLRRWAREGSLQSPRIHCTGHMLTSIEGHAADIGTWIDDETDLDAAVEHHLSTGPDLVKIAYDEHNWGVRPLITILSIDVLKGLIDRVHAAGHRVIVHASSEFRAREVIAAGADVLAHPVIQSPVTDEFVELVAASRIPVVSTLAIGDQYFRSTDDPGYHERGLYALCGDPTGVPEPTTAPADPRSSLPWADWMRVMTPIAQENLRRLVAGGAVVAAGTDLSFGPAYHRELELLQDAGIPPWEVIRSATHHGALALGRDEELGSTAPGALADLVVLEADPTVDVRNLATIEQIILDGRIVDQADLDLAVNR